MIIRMVSKPTLHWKNISDSIMRSDPTVRLIIEHLVKYIILK